MASSAAPNFILLFCDELRADCVGLDGTNPLIHTPVLDHLAAGGTVFRAAYTATPSCIPARSSLWSGQTPWHTGVLGMGAGQGPMPSDFPHTLAGELRGAGYHTHLVGTGHFHPPRAHMGFATRESRHGFGADDDYRRWFFQEAPAGVTPDDHGVFGNSWVARPWHTEERLHPSAWAVTKALEFFEWRDPSQPYFLNLSFQRPHAPWVPPAPFFDMYHNKKTLPPWVGSWATVHDQPRDAKQIEAWRGRQTPEAVHRARSGYYGEVSFVDFQIGRFLNLLRRLHPEALENTWILFAADHGNMIGDHHLWRKTYAYEGSARIPFLVRPPGGAQRQRATEPVSLYDIMPTVLEAAGLPIPKTVDGRSVLPLLEGPVPDWRDYIHGEHCTCYGPEQENQFVTDGKRKFIWFPRTGREQFFDLERDPGELRDLTAEPTRREEIGRWRDRLVHELAQRDCGWVRAGKLHCPDGEPLVSPWKDRRWTGE